MPECRRYFICVPMQFIGAQMFGYVVTCILLVRYIMFENIVNMVEATVICVGLLFIIMSCIQWTKFEEHKKAHVGKDDYEKVSRFAFVPYFVIPLVGVAFSVFCALFVGDLAVTRDYIHGSAETVLAISILGIVIYCLIDKYFVSKIGDSVYWKMFEEFRDKTVDKVTEIVNEKTYSAEEIVEMLGKLGKK